MRGNVTLNGFDAWMIERVRSQTVLVVVKCRDNTDRRASCSYRPAAAASTHVYGPNFTHGLQHCDDWVRVAECLLGKHLNRVIGYVSEIAQVDATP